jgi:hypothetical protein
MISHWIKFMDEKVTVYTVHYDRLDDRWRKLSRTYEEACKMIKPYLRRYVRRKSAHIPEGITNYYVTARDNLCRHLDKLGYGMPGMQNNLRAGSRRNCDF